MWKFYKLWGKTAFTGSWGQVEFWTGVAGAAALVIGHLYPQAVPYIDSLGFYVLAWACIVVVFARVLITPYWIYQENQKALLGHQSKLEGLHKAWDRTGKYDIPIRQAVNHIVSCFERNDATIPGMIGNSSFSDFNWFSKVLTVTR